MYPNEATTPHNKIVITENTLDNLGADIKLANLIFFLKRGCVSLTS